MPRGNKSGGKKHKRGKKTNIETKVLRYKEEGQEYAQISKCLGNCRFTVLCFDGKKHYHGVTPIENQNRYTLNIWYSLYSDHRIG